MWNGLTQNRQCSLYASKQLTRITAQVTVLPFRRVVGLRMSRITRQMHSQHQTASKIDMK